MASICEYEVTSESTADSRARSVSQSRVKPLHVLTLTPFYPVAGDDAAGCFIAEPLPFLAQLGIRNSVVAARPFYRHRRVSAHSTVHSATWVRYTALPGLAGLPFSGTMLYRGIRRAVDSLHAAQPLSLIHAHAALPCGDAAARVARDLGIPFVVTVHGRDVFSSLNSGLLGPTCKRVAHEVYEAASRVLCVSRKVEEDLLSGVDCRSWVVHNGVDTEMFCPAPSTEPALVVLSVGNLIPTKGHATLLKALAAVSKQYPRARCRIIGVGPEQQRLAHLAHQLRISDRVEFLGRQSRGFVAKAMQACSVFVLPSTYEGLGCVYLEAMAAGKPTIGCVGQGIAEIIKSGENGWLIQPNGVESLARALQRLLNDSTLRNRVGLAARQTVVETFSLQSQARRLAQVYRECVP